MGWFSSKKERPTAEDIAIQAIHPAIGGFVFGYASESPCFSDAKKWWTPAEVKAFAIESKVDRDRIWSTLGSNRRYLSPIEKKFSQTTPETVTERELINGTWRAEALGVILWTLSFVDRVLPYDESTSRNSSDTFGNLMTRSLSKRRACVPRKKLTLLRILPNYGTGGVGHDRSLKMARRSPDDPHFREAGFFSFDDIVRKTVSVHERTEHIRRY